MWFYAVSAVPIPQSTAVPAVPAVPISKSFAVLCGPDAVSILVWTAMKFYAVPAGFAVPAIPV